MGRGGACLPASNGSHEPAPTTTNTQTNLSPGTPPYRVPLSCRGGREEAATDPYIWLEDIDGQRSMDWVNAKNAATVAELSETPLYQPLYTRIKQILDSKDRIAYPSIVGDRIYNFWQDADHQRGIWRRTTDSDYLAGNPKWETVLDVDALAKAENVPMSYGGSDCLEPENRRCLISLSRGGSDAAEVREMDVVTKQFVNEGFKLPEAKTTTAWVDQNTLLVGTDFGQGSMTTSGYPRVIKLWNRGTPLSSATTVFEVPADHVAANASAIDAVGRRYIQISDGKTFYESAQYLYEKGKLVKFDIPADADLYLVRDQMIVYVRDPWTAGGTTWGTGSLVATSVDDFLGGKARPEARDEAWPPRDHRWHQGHARLPAARRAQQRER